MHMPAARHLDTVGHPLQGLKPPFEYCVIAIVWSPYRGPKLLLASKAGEIIFVHAPHEIWRPTLVAHIGDARVVA